jgi:flavin reductase (DIM6/NTAB) family NADH-FMN oxidoreductase RutF
MAMAMELASQAGLSPTILSVFYDKSQREFDAMKRHGRMAINFVQRYVSVFAVLNSTITD